MSDAEDHPPETVDFTEIVAGKMVAEQRQQLQAQVAQRQQPGADFELYEAAYVFAHLKHRIEEFEANLKDNAEIGLQLANFGAAAQLHIRSISYKNPNLIEFHGVDADGNEVMLIQHVDQLNFMLVAVKPIKEEPYRIGYRTDIA